MIWSQTTTAQSFWVVSSRIIYAATTIALVLSSGCGSNNPHTVPVTGVVSYNSKALSNGNVMLHPEDSPGYAATGIIGGDGSFELTTFKKGDGAVPGKYKATVQVFPEESEASGGPATGLPGMEFGVGVEPPIPMRYSDPATSTLDVVINDGETELQLELED